MSAPGGTQTWLALLASPQFILQDVHFLSQPEEVVISLDTHFLTLPSGDILGEAEVKEVPIDVLLCKNEVICGNYGLLMNQEWLLLQWLSLGVRSHGVSLHLPFLGDLGVEAQPRGATLDEIRDLLVANHKSRRSLIFW